MPHYTFRCEECGLVFDRYLSFQDSLENITCPQGHRQVIRLYRPPAIVFKGSGFYVTDHRKDGGNGYRSGEKKEPSSKGSVKAGAKETSQAVSQPT